MRWITDAEVCAALETDVQLDLAANGPLDQRHQDRGRAAIDLDLAEELVLVTRPGLGLDFAEPDLVADRIDLECMAIQVVTVGNRPTQFDRLTVCPAACLQREGLLDRQQIVGIDLGSRSDRDQGGREQEPADTAAHASAPASHPRTQPANSGEAVSTGTASTSGTS